MQPKPRALGIILMILILIFSSFLLGLSIAIIKSFQQYGDIFHPERNLSILNIIFSGFGITIGFIGLIAIITNRAALSRITAIACLSLGLFSFLSFIVSLFINSQAIDYVSSRFSNHMILYKNNRDARNIIDIIQTQYDCCGDNTWLDWASVSLDGTSSAIDQTTISRLSVKTTSPTSETETVTASPIANEITTAGGTRMSNGTTTSATTEADIDLDSNSDNDYYDGFYDDPSYYDESFGDSGDNTDPIEDFEPEEGITIDDSQSGVEKRSVKKQSHLNKAIRRRQRQLQSTYDNNLGLPLPAGIRLPQSCCTNDAPTKFNSLDSYCVSNANNAPNNFHPAGCSKKLGKIALNQTLGIAVVNICLIIFALAAGYFHGTCDKKTQHSLNRLKLSGLMY